MTDQKLEVLTGVLVGGNHLASALVGWLGAGEDTFPPYTTDYEKAREIIKDPNVYDAWVCWKSIMVYRDSLYEDVNPALPWNCFRLGHGQLPPR